MKHLIATDGSGHAPPPCRQAALLDASARTEYNPRMHVDVRNADDIIIVDLEGRLVAGDGDELLHDVINDLLAGDWKKILINLSEVPAIDSSGMGELVASQKIARRFGATVKLLQMQSRVQQALRLSQILPLFEIFEEEQDALAAFQEPPAVASD
jgi:anti-sigma B factor antagonist